METETETYFPAPLALFLSSGEGEGGNSITLPKREREGRPIGGLTQVGLAEEGRGQIFAPMHVHRMHKHTRGDRRGIITHAGIA